MSEPDEALIEAIAEAIHRESCSPHCVAPVRHALGQVNTASAAYAAMVEHLGLTEETGQHPRWVPDGPCNGACGIVARDDEHQRTRLEWVNRRRLVTPWTEVQP